MLRSSQGKTCFVAGFFYRRVVRRFGNLLKASCFEKKFFPEPLSHGTMPW